MPYYVYIMSNDGGIHEEIHLTNLVYCEDTDDVWSALQREKQIKGWLRRKKTALIESVNPDWTDLSEGWPEESVDPSLRSG